MYPCWTVLLPLLLPLEFYIPFLFPSTAFHWTNGEVNRWMLSTTKVIAVIGEWCKNKTHQHRRNGIKRQQQIARANSHVKVNVRGHSFIHNCTDSTRYKHEAQCNRKIAHKGGGDWVSAIIITEGELILKPIIWQSQSLRNLIPPENMTQLI